VHFFRKGCYPATKIFLKGFFGGAGETVETVKAKVGNDMNSHEYHGNLDVIAAAAEPGA
jgi:hypothetical protein